VFRPCWLEDALNWTGRSHVLFLPLGTPAQYAAAPRAGLKRTITTGVQLLWNQCAIARDMTRISDADKRPLWLVGHSLGNQAMWEALRNNNLRNSPSAPGSVRAQAR